MRKFEDLTDAEKELRTLIYAVESKDVQMKGEPPRLGEAYLAMTLSRAKETAIKLGIPLVEVKQ